MHNYTILLSACFFTLIIFSCGNPEGQQAEQIDPMPVDSGKGLSYISDDFQINHLPFDSLAYKTPYTTRALYDADSVPLYNYEGSEYYHPVYIAQYALNLVNRPDSGKYLRLKNIASRLLEEANTVESSLLFPYEFDFPLHGISSEVMKAPWYSGMAQGQILSLFCRIHEITEDSFYLQKAKLIFDSFKLLKGEGHYPWISCIDKNGHLWLEEFPRDIPNYTLNGKVFAILGVYDYYRLSGDKEALKILNASLTTIKSNMENFRVEGGISNYCLKHKVRDAGYHKVHIWQMKQLFKITDDPFFKEMKNLLLSDVPELKSAADSLKL